MTFEDYRTNNDPALKRSSRTSRQNRCRALEGGAPPTISVGLPRGPRMEANPANAYFDTEPR